MNRKIHLTSLLAATALISACSGLLTSDIPAKQIYLLEPLSTPAAVPTDDTLGSLNLTVSAVPGLDTDYIQALNPDSRLNRYANARWADHLPEVINSVLRRSLLSSGQFKSVSAGSRATADDWTLILEIQQFYGIQNSAGSTTKVTAEFESLLQCNGNKHRIPLLSSIPVHEERLSVVVSAHQQALNNLTQQLVDQVRSHCN